MSDPHLAAHPPAHTPRVGEIVQRNQDARSFKVMEGARVKVNFLIHYEIDQQTVKTALRLDEYIGLGVDVATFPCDICPGEIN